MKVTKPLALLVVVALGWWSVVPALAEEEGEEGSSETTEENVRYYYGRGDNPFYIPPGEEQEETFYFGESAQEDVVELKWSRFQDTSGRASRDIKKIIGVSLITTAVMMTAWALFAHSEETRPDNWQKIYEGTGILLVSKEKTVHVPSVVAGICLAGGGVWLMRRN
ncbi:MAG: hypothetical protein GTN49_05385 [candidate division Zixibacteria bacterium]|nr:hypothetical protein [candidate division Zixibacteria bacterium]